MRTRRRDRKWHRGEGNGKGGNGAGVERLLRWPKKTRPGADERREVEGERNRIDELMPGESSMASQVLIVIKAIPFERQLSPIIESRASHAERMREGQRRPCDQRKQANDFPRLVNNQTSFLPLVSILASCRV